MADATIRAKVVITNEKAMRALKTAAKIVRDIAEDMPWREDAQQATRALQYAAKHITVVKEN